MSSVSPACRKGDLIWRFLGITVKRVAPCRCLDGHVKEPYGMSMASHEDDCTNFYTHITTPYNRIEHSDRIHHISDGQQ